MMNYHKTALGTEVLHQRTLPLNARQRRVLLFIGTQDYAVMSESLRQRLAPPDLVDELIQLGLIETTAKQQSLEENATHTIAKQVDLGSSEIQTHHHLSTGNMTTDRLDENIATHLLQTIPTSPSVTTLQAEEISLEPMTFEEVKFLMMNILKQHCGLLAKQQIQQLNAAQNIASLKICQAQWITLLQETRLESSQLKQTLRQVNYALDHLQKNLNPT